MSGGADPDWEALCAQVPRWRKLARDQDEQTPHLSICSSQDDTMRGHPDCDCGAEPLFSPFEVRLFKLAQRNEWGCVPSNGMSFFTAVGATPAEAYWRLMRLTGWAWTGLRWERWSQ